MRLLKCADEQLLDEQAAYMHECIAEHAVMVAHAEHCRCALYAGTPALLSNVSAASTPCCAGCSEAPKQLSTARHLPEASWSAELHWLHCREDSARQCEDSDNDEKANVMQLLSTEMDERLLQCAMEGERGKCAHHVFA